MYYDCLSKIGFIEHSPFNKRAYNGVLIDETDSDLYGPQDEPRFELIKKILPVFFIDPQKAESRYPGLDRKLQKFFHNCSSFPPRSIRQSYRTEVECPVRVSSCANFEDSLSATTVNLSPNGCFLANPLKYEVGSKVWIKLGEQEDNSPLLSEVRWSSREACTDLPPGIGVKFLQATSHQIGQLELLLAASAT